MSDQPKSARAETLILFILGFGLFMFTRRSDVVPFIHVMIVIAPVFILRFSRRLPTKRAIWLTLLGFALAFNVSLWGLFQLDNPLATIAVNLARSTLLALIYALPFILDRIVFARKGNSIWSILFFPTAVTAVMFLVALDGPFDGTTAKTAYAYGSLHIQQLYSLTGLWGFTLLWSLPAVLINHAWEAGFERRTSIRLAAVFIVVVGSVVGYGHFRLSTDLPTETVRIGSAVLLPEDGVPVSMETVFAEKRLLPYAETLMRVAAMTSEAAVQGADLVVFNEHLITINEADIEATRADFARIAADHEVWLAVTYSWYAEEGLGANHLALFDDTGKDVLDYDKRYLLGIGPIGETNTFAKGAEVIKWVDAPFGRVAVSICRDMSYPAYARQAGAAGATLMLTPAYDFPESRRPWDYARSIENGFSMVRTVYNGVSFVADPNGRILEQVSSSAGGSGLMVVDVSIGRLETLYARWGDWLGWLSLGIVVLVLGNALIFAPHKD